MLKTLEFWGAPAIAIYRRFDYRAVFPICLSIALAIALWGVFAPASLKAFGIATLMLVGFYLFTGYVFFRRQHLQLSMSLLDDAIAGDWKFDQKVANSRWANHGIVPLVLAFGTRVNGLTKQTGITADALLTSAQAGSSEANNLSARADEIAAMLEETAASLEQFTASINRNAESCNKVRELSTQATEAAYDGADQVSAINAAVHQTGVHSRRVIEIISHIEGFANQTHILALNAAIEAARVGSHGKGFTQVADEVRELANKSADASRLIKERVLAASEKIQQGVSIANESALILEDVMTQVAQTNELVDDIANASTEQSAGVSQIKLAIEQMATLTQHNCNAVEQAAKLAKDLEREAHALDRSLSGLKASRFNSEQACIDLVKRAVAHVLSVGAEAAATGFLDRARGFHDRDLFIVLVNLNDFVIAHGGDSSLTRTNVLELKDANGFAFVKEQVRLAKSVGHGWCEFEVRNPISGVASRKKTYTELVPGTDYMISCGVFTELKEAAVA
jgi:methyl-accepting chemotaxis protein